MKVAMDRGLKYGGFAAEKFLLEGGVFFQTVPWVN